MKLLFYGESALNPTGFGNVNKHLLAACARVADVTHVATTHYREDYNHEEYPYEIIGCEIVDVPLRDATHQRNLPNIMKEVDALDWDVFFFQGDMGWSNDVLVRVGQIQQEHPEKHSIFYMPIDGDTSHPLAFNIFQLCSAPVVYTEHGKSVIEKYAPSVAAVTSVIPLGTEPEVFFPLSEEKRKEARLNLFGDEYTNQFLCINVNRNQPRKDLARSMAAFHLFHEKHPDSSLYLHSVMQDAGGHLPTQAALVGADINVRPAEILFSDLNLANPWSRDKLNDVYNAADVLISTAYGEGWGLTTTEAMAAGTPVMVPANTANLDLLGRPMSEVDPLTKARNKWGLPALYESFDRERGWGVRSGGDLDHTQFMYANGGGGVPIIHAESFVETLEYIYNHRDYARDKARRARKWCLENTWERRENEWVQLLQLMAKTTNALQTTTA